MSEEKKDDVLMEKDGQKTEVAAGESVEIMKKLGWKPVKAEPAKSDEKKS